jgi:DNA mismatch endonuclease (patch repair protein)
MSVEKRSALMARIKGKNTGPERVLAALLGNLGLRWESHSREFPGCPDFIFREHKVAIFVDGDFWHGWRFSVWRNKLSEKWEQKIDQNRKRDRRNHARLRRQGWKVIRVWEHQIERDLAQCLSRVKYVLRCTDRSPANLLVAPPQRAAEGVQKTPKESVHLAAELGKTAESVSTILTTKRRPRKA